MSKVAITGNASGTGTLTIAAPSTNTDRTLTLPDSAGTMMLTDTGVTTAQMPAGSVIQVVNTTYTGAFSQALSYNTKINNVQASITPTNTSSKILIMCHVFFEGSVTDASLGWFLYRDSTLLRAPIAGSRLPVIAMAGAGYHLDNQASTPATVAIHYFDTPNTTSAITYAPGAYHASSTIYINRTVDDTDNSGHERGISSITLMEIAA